MMHRRLRAVGRLARRYLRALGPGVITGASDDDPASIGTYAQTGALFGYAQLWMPLFTFPMMVVTQEMCARIALHTRLGLAEVLQRYYPRALLYLAVGILVVTNLLTIGADLGAMAAASMLVAPLPYWAWMLLLAAVLVGLQITVRYEAYARVLRLLTLSLLAYVLVVFLVPQRWDLALQATLVPTVLPTRVYLLNLVALLGSVISPYLFFWNTGQHLEETLAAEHHVMVSSRGGATPAKMAWMRADIVTGMFLSNLVMWFIIATTASTLHAHGVREIDSAVQAAAVLRPLAGSLAGGVFALGIVGTGLLAIPVMAGSTAYALATLMRLRQGFSWPPRQAPGFYGVIVASVLVGMLFGFTGLNPLDALYYTAVLDGLVAPPLLLMLMLVANNPTIMGRRRNGRAANLLGWLTTGVVSVSTLALLYSIIRA
jgi:NRAMP (natural resistance-associated macrophage protein)-like metal ion transporter